MYNFRKKYIKIKTETIPKKPNKSPSGNPPFFPK